MIRFNHKVHLKEGGIPVLDESGRALQRRSEVRLKQLQCADCHMPDSQRALMKPIDYAGHCQSCHPLSIQIVAPTLAGNRKVADTIEQFNKRPALHPGGSSASNLGPDPGPFTASELVRADLRDRYTDFFQQHRPPQAGQEQPVPLPGERHPQSVDKSTEDWVNGQLAAAEDRLFKQSGGCRLCHGEPVRRRRDGLPAYARSAIPPTWFQHARFSHNAHQMLECLACHGRAPQSEETSEVLLPNIESCRQCHNQQSVRSECAHCHRYHDPAQHRGLNGKSSIAEWIAHGKD